MLKFLREGWEHFVPNNCRSVAVSTLTSNAILGGVWRRVELIGGTQHGPPRKAACERNIESPADRCGLVAASLPGCGPCPRSGGGLLTGPHTRLPGQLRDTPQRHVQDRLPRRLRSVPGEPAVQWPGRRRRAAV